LITAECAALLRYLAALPSRAQARAGPLALGAYVLYSINSSKGTLCSGYSGMTNQVNLDKITPVQTNYFQLCHNPIFNSKRRQRQGLS
jgi:hypothetical protein